MGDLDLYMFTTLSIIGVLLSIYIMTVGGIIRIAIGLLFILFFGAITVLSMAALKKGEKYD